MTTMPTVNINGTDGAALRHGYMLALNAVNDAIVAMGQTFPHGRDYQLAPERASVARAEFEAHVTAMAKVRDYLEEIVLDINAQIDGRKR